MKRIIKGPNDYRSAVEQCNSMSTKPFNAIDNKVNLQDVQDENKVTIVMTVSEYNYLMDLIELKIHTDICPELYRELDKKPKKQDKSAIEYLRAQRLSVQIIKERLLAAWETHQNR